jgi:hypothetical protein
MKMMRWSCSVLVMTVLLAATLGGGSLAARSQPSQSAAQRFAKIKPLAMNSRHFLKFDREHQIQILRAYMEFLRDMEASGLPVSVANNSAEDPLDFLRGGRDASAGPGVWARAYSLIRRAKPVAETVATVAPQAGMSAAKKTAVAGVVAAGATGMYLAGSSSSSESGPVQEAASNTAQVEDPAQALGEEYQTEAQTQAEVPAATRARGASATNGTSCFYAGWVSSVMGGLCANPARTDNDVYKAATAACGGQGMACNPVLFGPGICGSTGKFAFKSCLERFKSKKPARSLEDVVNTIKGSKDLKAEFDKVAQAVGVVCAPGGFQAAQGMCTTLRNRIGEIVQAASSASTPQQGTRAPAEDPVLRLPADAKSDIDLASGIDCFQELEGKPDDEATMFAIVPGTRANKTGVYFYAKPLPDQPQSMIGFVPEEQHNENLTLAAAFRNTAVDPYSRAHLEVFLQKQLEAKRESYALGLEVPAPGTPAVATLPTSDATPLSVPREHLGGYSRGMVTFGGFSALSPSTLGESSTLPAGTSAVAGAQTEPAPATAQSPPIPASAPESVRAPSSDPSAELETARHSNLQTALKAAEACEKVQGAPSVVEEARKLKQAAVAYAQARGLRATPTTPTEAPPRMPSQGSGSAQ